MNRKASARIQATTATLVLAVAILCSSAVVHARPVLKQPTRLEFYLHEQFVTVPGYEATDILLASATGNTSTYAWGNLGISEQVIRVSASNTSQIIGRAPGTFQPNKEERTFALYKLLTVETERYKGTIVVFCDWLSNAESNEWTVVGGTGSFRMARGYALNTKADGGAGTQYIIFKWDFFLTY